MSEELTLRDRCDHCGAAAKVRVTKGFHEAPELYFCGHHFKKHSEELLRQGWGTK